MTPNKQQFKADEEEKPVAEISSRQYSEVAQSIYEEFKRRKEHKDRKQAEELWAEVDRQVSMTSKPNAEKGRKSWHPEFELPYQANAVEVLATDADAMMFPNNGHWFNVHAQMTDEYLERFIKDVRFLNGDNPEQDLFRATQEDINNVNQALLMHVHQQYNFQDKIKLSNAQAFKYGTRAVRVRAIKSTTFRNEFHGVTRTESMMPVVAPISIKDFYPDDVAEKALAHGMHLRPTELLHGKHRITDLKLAAKAGNTKTEDSVNGGWIKKELENLSLKSADPADPYVSFIEAEGDLVVPVHNGEDIVAPNMIVTVMYGKACGAPKVIRIRENPQSFNSVFWSNYFQDNIGIYCTSPLMKGTSIQKVAQEAAESVAIISRLDADPAIAVNRNDPSFRRDGEYDIYPGAQLDILTKPDPIKIGDLGAAAQVFSQMTKQYEDTVGVNALRLGAQTKSHQTAHAVESERTQGQSRTVGFVRSQERGFMTNILQAEAEIIRDHMQEQNVFVPGIGNYVVASGNSIAPDLTFNVQGSSAPNVAAQQDAKKQQTIQALAQIEPLAAQGGGKPLNWDYFRELFLREAFPDSEATKFFSQRPAPAAPQPGAPANPGQVGPIPPGQ